MKKVKVNYDDLKRYLMKEFQIAKKQEKQNTSYILKQEDLNAIA